MMEKYKITIRRNLFLSAALCLFFGLLLVSVFVWLGPTSDQGSDFVRGFSTGVVVAMIVLTAISAVRYRRALRDEAMLRRLYIKDTDERSRLIRLKTGSVGFQLSAFILLAATAVSGFIDIKVFFSLLGAVGVICIVKTVLLLVYSKKY